METKYLSAAETAKVVRKILKEKFAGTKFSVRSETYSMGSSVRVAWRDGPTERAVNNAVGFLAGSDFDGSIDLKVSVYHWMLPSGEIVLADSQGTEGSKGYLPAFSNKKPHPDAIRVNLADHISLTRRYSREFLEVVVRVANKIVGGDKPNIVGSEEFGYWIDASVSNDRIYYRIMANSTLSHGKSLVCYDETYGDLIRDE
jgi:hypothetical protein